jgi:hypothetical protein
MRAKKRKYITLLNVYKNGVLVPNKNGAKGIQDEGEHFRPRTAAYNITRRIMPERIDFEKYDPYEGLEFDSIIIQIDIEPARRKLTHDNS